MLVLGEGGFLIELVLLVYCVLNIATTPEGQVRNLPKLAWLVLVVLLPLVGGIAWLVAGRPVGPILRAGRVPKVPHGSPFERPGRTVASNPDDDEAFLRGLRERAEEQRRKAKRLDGEPPA